MPGKEKKQGTRQLGQMRRRKIQPCSRIQIAFVFWGFVSPTKGKDKGKIFFTIHDKDNGISVFPVRADGKVLRQKAEGFFAHSLVDVFNPRRLGVNCNHIDWVR